MIYQYQISDDVLRSILLNSLMSFVSTMSTLWMFSSKYSFQTHLPLFMSSAFVLSETMHRWTIASLARDGDVLRITFQPTTARSYNVDARRFQEPSHTFIASSPARNGVCCMYRTSSTTQEGSGVGSGRGRGRGYDCEYTHTLAAQTQRWVLNSVKIDLQTR